MMASIPNMRSNPLPVPASKAVPTDPGSGGFTIQLPATPGQPVQPGQPIDATAPVDLTPVEPADGVAPQVVDLDGGEDHPAGDATAQKSKMEKKEADPQACQFVPFLPDQPAVPVPQIPPADAGEETPVAATASGPAASAPRLPVAPAFTPTLADAGKNPRAATDAGSGKQAQPAPADSAEAVLADAPEIEAAVKALVQRKQVLTKQVAALPKTARGETAEPDRDPARPNAPAATPLQAPAAPVAIQAAAPLPAADTPQPALSPAASQPIPAAADKKAAIDGMRSTDLAGAERKLDLARDTAWLDRLAHDIARAASDDAPLRFRLHPQTLGSLQVELQQSDRGTAVRMTVDSEAARQILSDAQPRLAAEARAQGVRIAETHVDLSGSGRQAPGDQRRQDDARQTTPFIRTATGADGTASARTSGRARLDRYA